MDQYWLGFLSALLVVLIGQVAAFILQRKAHAHELHMAKLRRESDARLNAYLDAAAAATEMNSVMATIPNRKLPTDGSVFPEFLRAAVAFNRLHFFCNVETLRITQDLTFALISAGMRAVILRVPIELCDAANDRLHTRIRQLEHLDQQVQEQLKAYNQGAIPVDHGRNARLYEQSATYNGEMANLWGASSEIAKLKVAKLMEANREVQALVPGLYDNMARALIAFRTELGITIDADQYAVLVRESADRYQQLIGGYFEEVIGATENDQAEEIIRAHSKQG